MFIYKFLNQPEQNETLIINEVSLSISENYVSTPISCEGIGFSVGRERFENLVPQSAVQF